MEGISGLHVAHCLINDIKRHTAYSTTYISCFTDQLKTARSIIIIISACDMFHFGGGHYRCILQLKFL